MVRDIRIADYDYPLPDSLIARHPCEPRDACRLLVRHHDGTVAHHGFRELPGLLPDNALMVCNNTRVINARIKMHKPTGAEIEIFCLEPCLPRDYAQAFAATGHCSWVCLVGNVKRWKEGALDKELEMPDGSRITLHAVLAGTEPGGARRIDFSWEPAHATFATVIERAGYIPIPPYLCRDSELSDTVDYQTVYSKTEGSVAAPTAGLHFTPSVLDAVRERGIGICELTLHVGAGTFQPVKSDVIGEHPMHTETVSVTLPLLDAIIEARSGHRPVTAVGTTSVRTLESLPYLGRMVMENPGIPPSRLHVEQWDPYGTPCFDTDEALRALRDYIEQGGHAALTASTAIMIAPGFRWRVVDGMVTNFHQPQSTLLLLVASFLQRTGRPDEWRDIYTQAAEAGYRFLSYGDAMLLL